MAMSQLVNKLQTLSDILTHLDIGHARDVAQSFNRRLSGLLGSDLIISRLYWREPSMGGGNLLKPIAFKKGETHDAVRDPEQFVIPPTDPDGILSWSFKEEATIWVEHLERGPQNAEIIEPSDAGEVSPEFLTSQYEPSSMLVFPLKDQGFVIGVFCIDLSKSGVITAPLFNELQPVRHAFSRFLVFAHKQKETADAADRAVKNFLDEVREIGLPKELLQTETDHRRAFFARPFLEEFSDLERRIRDCMSDNGVEARSFVPSGDAHTVVDSIIAQIDDAHFGIADITRANPNVLAEVGMMFMANKRVMLLRSKNDSDPVPFNLAHRYVYEYTFESATDTFLAHLKGERSGLNFNQCMQNFLEDLEVDDQFRNAPKFKSRKDSKKRPTRSGTKKATKPKKAQKKTSD